MSHDYKIEDTVVLLDTSRSMLRKDFKPNRLNVAIQAIKNFIHKKLLIDPKDRISLISFGDITKRLSPFTNDEEQLVNSFKRITISGRGLVHEGIAFCLQLLVEEMRKIGGKVQRVLIISDDKLKNDLSRLQKMINIAKGLGIIIDACQLGKTQDYKQSTLKRIAQVTGGEYGYFNNSKAIINAGISFASKKTIKESTDYFGPDQKDKSAPLISEVALSLRRPTVVEVRRMMGGGGRGQEKCQICHTVKAPGTGADFYSEGRYCPSCDRPMHLSCAAGWAQSQSNGLSDNVFRCPFCFFLLELPKSVLKLVKGKSDAKETQKVQIITEERKKQTRLIEIDKVMVETIDASCSYCHNIFLGEYKVFKCQKCGSYYHEPCLQKMYKELNACRYCGAEILL